MVTVKYMLLIYSNAESWAGLSAEQRDGLTRAHENLTRELTEQGLLVSAAGLADPITTRTVQVRDDTATSTIDASRMIMNPVRQSNASANQRFECETISHLQYGGTPRLSVTRQRRRCRPGVLRHSGSVEVRRTCFDVPVNWGSQRPPLGTGW